MEDQNSQIPATPIHPVMDVMPAAVIVPPFEAPIVPEQTIDTTVPPQKTSYHHKRKIGRVIVGIVLLIIIAGLILLFLHHSKPAQLTPAETLQALKASSKPVTATIPERGNTVNTLSKQSSPVVTSNQDQLQMLNALSK